MTVIGWLTVWRDDSLLYLVKIQPRNGNKAEDKSKEFLQREFIRKEQLTALHQANESNRRIFEGFQKANIAEQNQYAVKRHIGQGGERVFNADKRADSHLPDIGNQREQNTIL